MREAYLPGLPIPGNEIGFHIRAGREAPALRLARQFGSRAAGTSIRDYDFPARSLTSPRKTIRCPRDRAPS